MYYVFYMGNVEEYQDILPTEKHPLGTWACLIQQDGSQAWGQLEEQVRIKQPPLKNWFQKHIDKVPKELRTQLLLLRG